jgi:hypothetical protein
VAEAQSLSKRVGLTPAKGALIGVLAVALVGVIYFQYGSSDGEAVVTSGSDTQSPPPLPAITAQALPAPNATFTPPEVASQIATDANEVTAVTARFDESKWKPPEVAKVVAYDPFALPAAFPQPVQMVAGVQSGADDAQDTDATTAAAKLAEAIESLQAELRALQERGVHVIIRGGDEYVAMIGDRTVRVGDEINGFTVTSIEPNGVRVERKLHE